MRRSLLSFVLLSLLTILPVLAGGPSADKAPLTLGEMAVTLAQELSLPVAGPDPGAASDALAARGIALEGDLDAPLSEGEVVAILNQLGMQLRTSYPQRPFSRDKLKIVMQLLHKPPEPEPAAEAPPEKPAPPTSGATPKG